MHIFSSLLDFVLHINDHLDAMVSDYGTTIYVILFAIIFVETGVVIMPFLPGDSLLFAAGAICARQYGVPNAAMNIFVLISLLFLAAVLGDCSNYAIGKFLGKHAVNWKIGKRNLVKQAYIDKTHGFFEKYGTKAIIMARFVPIVRTFTPFVAGVGDMKFRMKFLPFDIAGGFLWVSTMTLSGFFLGQNEWVKKHFEAVVVMIILISIVPMIVGYLQHKFKKKTT
jgi:membrane-associated protein